MNKHLYKAIRSCILVITFFLGCAGPFRSNKPLPQISQTTLTHRIQGHVSQLQTFQGRGKLTVISQEGSFQGSVKISAKMPDSLWIKIEGPLGIDLATGRFGGEQILLYVPLENIVYVGFIEEIQEPSILPFNMGVSDLLLGLLGLMTPPDDEQNSLLSISPDNRRYILQCTNKDLIWIEPKGPVISRWEQKNGKDEILWTWEGKNFKNKKGVRLPQMIQMTSYKPKQQVTLFYEAVETNRIMENDWAEITIPEGVQYVRF
ncbi:DUF4292 domain-containing protein [bacterium]|nr:DUF4292 domain-containing protein [bacterium]